MTTAVPTLRPCPTTPGRREIVLGDDTVAGIVQLAPEPDALRITGFAIEPAHQRQSIGTCILRELQREARLAGHPLTASIPRLKPARQLFDRHGFQSLAEDPDRIELRWHAPQTVAETRAYAERILAFLRDIGLAVELGDVPYTSFLPGIELIPNGLRVDLDRLLYAGDLLHEAGHIAALPPDARAAAHPTPQDGDEAVAMVWSYAAARHLGIPSHIVFHDCGYRGDAVMLRENFDAGQYIGLPLFAWYGFTTPALPNTPSLYPEVLHWLRPAPREQEALSDETA